MGDSLALRFMTNSSYRAHTTPLLINHGLLNVRDMYKLKLLMFYYKLAYDLLPPCFNNYIDIIEQKPARESRFQFIHAPLVKRVYAECSPLFQPIKLFNSLKNDANDTILKKIGEKSHSYNGFAFNVTRCFLDTYDPICRIETVMFANFNRPLMVDLSWIHMTPSAELKSNMFVNFNKTLMVDRYLVIILLLYEIS